MPWKKNADGALEIVEDKPVWVNDAGEEKPFDYAAFSKRLADTTKESVERKEKLRVLEAKYAKFKDIEDLDAWWDKAMKGIDMLDHADDSKKAIEEQVRARVEAANKPLLEQLAVAKKEVEALTAGLQQEKVNNAFTRSNYVRDKLVNGQLAADLFAKNFVVRDGKLIALDENGKDLYGADGLATFDEAIQHFVMVSPYKDTLLKGSMGTGSGSNPSSSGSRTQSGGKNPWAKDSWNATQQMKLVSDDPQLAKSMAAAAGIKLNI